MSQTPADRHSDVPETEDGAESTVAYESDASAEAGVAAPEAGDLAGAGGAEGAKELEAPADAEGWNGPVAPESSGGTAAETTAEWSAQEPHGGDGAYPADASYPEHEGATQATYQAQAQGYGEAPAFEPTQAYAPTHAYEEAAAAVPPAAAPAPAKRVYTGPRRVRLSLSRVDPWSVMKLGFLLSVALGIITVVAAAVAWRVVDSMGVFADLESLINDLGATNQFGVILNYLRLKNVMSLATIVAIINVALLTALSTLGAFLYNIVAALVGGLHMTLTDD